MKTEFLLFRQGNAYSEKLLQELYIGMSRQNLWEKVFWKQLDENWHSFFNFVSCETWFYLGLQDEKVVGAIWFTTFTEDHCSLHFCSIKGYESSKWKVQIGNLLQNILDKSENPCYKVIAKTPHKGLSRMYKHMGFELCTTDGKFYYLEKRKHYE